MDYYSLYVTTRNAEEARTIGRALVEARLAACVNVVDSIESIYAWEGQVHDEAESLFFAKTTSSRLQDAMAKIKELHSYDCPCIVALPFSRGHAPYLQWIGEQTR